MEIKGVKVPGNDHFNVTLNKKDLENVGKVNQENANPLSDRGVSNVPVQTEKNTEQIEILRDSLERLKKIFRGEAEFKIDKDTNMVVIKIKDPESGEIIRQIPPELALKLAKNIQELLGVLMDERV
ncbi:MAG: flagellar protein FlaG [Fervidobacterium sp.]